MMNAQMKTGRRSGFTLIELLVVVAIVGILAALIFPALAQTREKAKASTCLNNLKQWMLASQLYMDDSNEFLPMDTDTSGADNPTWAQVYASPNAWFNVLPPYVNRLPMSSYGATNAATLYTGGTIFHCPSAKWVGNEASAAGPQFSYAFDSKIFTGSHPVVRRPELDNPPLDSGAVNSNNRPVNPSTVVMLFDTHASAIEPPSMPGITGTTLTTVGSPHGHCSRTPLRHGGRINIAFFDGHVESFSPIVLIKNNGDNLTTSPVIWNPWKPDAK